MQPSSFPLLFVCGGGVILYWQRSVTAILMVKGLAQEFQLTKQDQSEILSAFFIGYLISGAIVAVVLTRILQRFKPEHVCCASILLSSVCTLGLAADHNSVGVYLEYLLQLSGVGLDYGRRDGTDTSATGSITLQDEDHSTMHSRPILNAHELLPPPSSRTTPLNDLNGDKTTENLHSHHIKTQLYFLRFLSGLCQAFFLPACFAFYQEQLHHCAKRKTEGVGRLSACANIAVASVYFFGAEMKDEEWRKTVVMSGLVLPLPWFFTFLLLPRILSAKLVGDLVGNVLPSMVKFAAQSELRGINPAPQELEVELEALKTLRQDESAPGTPSEDQDGDESTSADGAGKHTEDGCARSSPVLGQQDHLDALPSCSSSSSEEDILSDQRGTAGVIREKMFINIDGTEPSPLGTKIKLGISKKSRARAGSQGDKPARKAGNHAAAGIDQARQLKNERCLEEQRREKGRHLISTTHSMTSLRILATFLQTKPYIAVVIGHFCHTTAAFMLMSWLPTFFGKENAFFSGFPYLLAGFGSPIWPEYCRRQLEKGRNLWAVRRELGAIGLLLPGIALLLVLGIVVFLESDKLQDGEEMIKPGEATKLNKSASSQLILLSKAVLFSAVLFFGAATSSSISMGPLDLAARKEHSGTLYAFSNTFAALPGILAVRIAADMGTGVLVCGCLKVFATGVYWKWGSATKIEAG
ncbi:unnamed protein product [Amoebophrya sp. A120]|nr:unnamed protein product [Amoebophrya sp. A120]|eukprot:GSA120T00025618001.1